ADDVLELRGGDPRQAHDVEEHIEAAAEAEGEAPAGEPVQGRRERRGQQRVPGVVVGGGGGDPDPLARRGGGPGQRGGLLGREPLGQEDRPESEALALGDLGEQVARRGGMAGQPVEPQFRKIVHERFLTSGPSPRPSRDRTLVWTPVRINPPPGRHARSRPPRPCRPVLVTRYGTWRFRGWPSATSGWSKAN